MATRMWAELADYSARNRLIVELKLGANYADYLGSPLWRSIRSRVLDRDKLRCTCCSKRANQVHHLDYSRVTLLGESLNGLVSICRRCHKRIEYTKKGAKRSLSAANRMLWTKPPKKRKKKQKAEQFQPEGNDYLCAFCGWRGARLAEGDRCPKCKYKGTASKLRGQERHEWRQAQATSGCSPIATSSRKQRWHKKPR